MTGHDVIVVGAGVHGASAALDLARRGLDVLVLDRADAPAEGPTGRSSAVCRAYYTNPFLAEVAHDALRLFDDFGPLVEGGDTGYQRYGALFLHDEADRAEVVPTLASLRSIGTSIELVEHESLTRLQDGLSVEASVFGVWEEHAGQADPVRTTMTLFRAAREAGATARFGTIVERIEPAKHGPVRVHLGDEVLEADRVLLAVGPWTVPLAASFGVDLPLIVERHVVATYGWGPVAPVPFVLADLPNAYYGTPEGPGQFALGPLDAGPVVDPDRDSPAITETEQVELLTAAVRRHPALEEAEVRGGWASVYDVSPDWQPVIGEIAPGVVVDAGTSGHGFKLAPVLGRHVAGLVVGDVIDDRLHDFHPSRFERGESIPAGFGEHRIIG